MLKKVEKAGIKGLKRKRKPYNLLPEHFFDEVETLQKNFSNLINCKEHKRIAITPSVSYGLGNITNNINISKRENIVFIQVTYSNKFRLIRIFNCSCSFKTINRFF